MTRFQSFVLSVIDAYATVIFGKSKIVGLLILTATFTVPFIGLAGLLGTAAALLFTKIYSLEPWDSKSGLYGFNALLVSLGLGFYYPLSNFSFPLFLVVLTLISVLSVLFFVSANHISMTYLKLPSMSLAFSLAAIFFILFWYALGNTLTYYPPEPLFDLSLPLPDFWTAFFESLGSIFFLPFTLTGLIIGLALVINSRIAAILALLGFTTIWIFYSELIPAAYIQYPGLNSILIAITVGGIFLVPGKTSYLLAIFSVIIGGIFLSAMQVLFQPYAIPPFTFPYVLTVFLVIYPLSLRLRNERPYLIDFGTYHPEQNLVAYYTKSKRFYQTGAPQFYLPVIGEWRITQGNSGDITHKYQWAYAWDFEMYNKQGEPNTQQLSSVGKNDRPENYYAYGKPVLSSADGYVAKVIDGIADNPIGQINTKENWGNVITIYHSAGVYTLYGHLKNGSVKVKEGEYVKKGDRIAAVGNSGRSAVPHLHFNVQIGSEPGANTIKSYIANFKKIYGEENKGKANSTYKFHPYAIPAEGDTVSPLVPSLQLQDLLHLKVSDTNRFKVRFGKQTFNEEWEITTNFLGQLLINSNRGSCLEFSFYDGIYNLLHYKGSKKTALFAFAAIVSRLPYQENIPLSWEDEPPLSVFTPCCRENILLITHSIAKVVTVTNSSEYTEKNDMINVSTVTTRKVFNSKREIYKGSVTFKKLSGIEKIELYKTGKLFMEVESE